MRARSRRNCLQPGPAPTDGEPKLGHVHRLAGCFDLWPASRMKTPSYFLRPRRSARSGWLYAYSRQKERKRFGERFRIIGYFSPKQTSDEPNPPPKTPAPPVAAQVSQGTRRGLVALGKFLELLARATPITASAPQSLRRCAWNSPSSDIVSENRQRCAFKGQASSRHGSQCRNPGSRRRPRSDLPSGDS